MKKKIVLIIMGLILVTACGKVPKLANGEEAVVSFKNENLSISATDLYNALKEKYALNILVDMIDLTILENKYPDEKEKASQYGKDQVADIKTYYKDENGKYDEASLLEGLKQAYGFNNLEEFEKALVLSYYRSKAIDDYAKSQITNKQINDYYKKETVGDIECSHILIGINVSADATDEQKKDAETAAKKQAETIIKDLDNGADFAELAKKHSTDTSNSESGGALGYFNKGKMEIEFETAAYALKLNAYTKKPVKTKYGYHIILKTGEKEKAPLDEVKDKIIDTLALALQNQDYRLSIDALVELRKAYGFNIEDSTLDSQYTKYISNQIINAQNKESAE